MRRFFGRLPNDLQSKIMLSIPTWRTPPPPRFAVGQRVRLTNACRARMMENLAEKLAASCLTSVGPVPIGQLLTIEGRRWRAGPRGGGQWLYDYAYGLFGDHEGTALQTDIQLAR